MVLVKLLCGIKDITDAHPYKWFEGMDNHYTGPRLESSTSTGGNFSSFI